MPPDRPACEDVVEAEAPPRVEELTDVLFAPPNEPAKAAEFGPPITPLVPVAVDDAVELPPALPATVRLPANAGPAAKPSAITDARSKVFIGLIPLLKSKPVARDRNAVVSVERNFSPWIRFVKVQF